MSKMLSKKKGIELPSPANDIEADIGQGIGAAAE